jgi:hypothetical protein
LGGEGFAVGGGHGHNTAEEADFALAAGAARTTSAVNGQANPIGRVEDSHAGWYAGSFVMRSEVDRNFAGVDCGR